MRRILMAAITMVVAMTVAAADKPDREVIAQDSVGLVVMVKEQYGSYTMDTCTVVMLFRGNFVLVHRATGSAWYPASFNSIKVVAKLSDRPVVEAIAGAPEQNSAGPVLSSAAASR